MLRIEIVIDLDVDLLAIGVVIGAIRQPECGAVMSTAQPLMDRGVQSISTIEHIRMRHCSEVLLRDARRILLRTVASNGVDET